MLPIIGIAASRMFLPGNTLDKYYYVGNGYVDGVARSGGIPFILPLMHEPNRPIRELVEAVDGIILTGGEDPAPHLFGEEPHAKLGEVDYERDLAELELIQHAIELKKPILGICRGMQILNVALGGTLIQDIPSQVEGAFQHSMIGSRQHGAHKVTLTDGFIRQALGTDQLLVNTSHHQSVKDIAPGFRITAISADGVIEAMESDDGQIIGVQWHPERMWMHDDTMLKLAHAFIQKVKGHSTTTA
ncbi:gamma-glutamyl-gamma-aminobutyrate hydrolase family protein [Brevibacillus dissolubilis]|uniref:gamma-glutamyl-gamma-aminobutyrate hydrolase family protein n=1 Tax=Brevibacillus dissolubilis TaxID=1844116 RepID=UPI001115DC68|nr:gamma-glutamyl-gamma-aminobutyrate hydrolase family protein [Brevibacillus dissolubilis]